VVGGLVFLGAVWLPGLRVAAGAAPAWQTASTALATRAARVALASVALGIVTTALGIVLQGANAGGTSFWSALDPDVIEDVLETRFGTVWGLRLLDWALLAAFALAVLAGRRLPVLRPASLGATGLAAGRLASPWLLALLVLPLGFLVVSPGLAGHAGVTDPTALNLAIDAVHVLAMSVWLGGLASLLLVLPAATRELEPSDRTRLLAACLRRFSPLALASVGALLATGILQSIAHLESLGDLTGSAFGRAILIKAVLMVALVGLGALNLRHNRPRLERLAAEGAAPGAAGRLLRRAVRAEVALIAVVLGVTAALTSYPPPGAVAGGPFSTSTELGPARLELTVDPASRGANEIHLYLFDARTGAQYDRAKRLKVALRLPDRQIGPLVPRLDKAGPGHYVARRALISPGGDWQLSVAARVSDFEEYRARVEVPVE
jgi:copper transport protein